MEVIYKFLFSGPVFHQLWYSFSDDVSSSFFRTPIIEQVTSTILSIFSLQQLFEIDLLVLAYRARYGVQLEKGAFEKRTADFLWMMIFGAISLLVSGCFLPFPFALNTKRQLLNLHMIVYCLNQVLSAIPLFKLSFLGIPMVSMLLYVWSREYPNSQINMYGLVQLRVCNIIVLLSPLPIFMLHNQCSNHYRPGNLMVLSSLQSFYLPWAMLGLDVIFGSPLLPGFMGIIVGHLYYFLAVLHPLATGKNYLKTPKWVYPFTRSWPNNSILV